MSATCEALVLRDWEQGREARSAPTPTPTPGWFLECSSVSLHAGKGRGTACPCGLHQCLVFLGRECPNLRLNIAQLRAASLDTQPAEPWAHGMAGGLTAQQVCVGGCGQHLLGCRGHGGLDPARLRCHCVGAPHPQPSRLVKACQEVSLNQMYCHIPFNHSTPEAGESVSSRTARATQ